MSTNTCVSTVVPYAVVDTTTDLDDMCYPFLPHRWRWQIRSRPLTCQDHLAALRQDDIQAMPTLRWVKDGQVMDLFIPGMDARGFWSATGLRASLHKGGYVFSKRLGRLLRPYRFWAFFDVCDLDINHNPCLDVRLWDGCGLMSRSVVERMAKKLNLSPRHRRELLQTRRFEVTLMHPDGQEKGDVLVSEALDHDFVFPTGSTKTEITLEDGRIFVGLTPRHSHQDMRLDIQSLINLHPFFKREHLLTWMRLDGWLFLSAARNAHDLGRVMKRLYQIETPDELEKLGNWHVSEYLASGGHILWFAGMVKAIGRSHIKRLTGNLARYDRETGDVRKYKLRFPAPGGRMYIFPAAVGQRDVPRGHIELDPPTATAWVNDEDWREYIVRVLGGCDGDDALWLFPFSDRADGERKILVWRSPNQWGEYVLLRPTARSQEMAWDLPEGKTLAWPPLDSRDLPPRIDTQDQVYAPCPGRTGTTTADETYTIAAMWPTVVRTLTNAHTLGGFCNLLMIWVLLHGRLPALLPARLEEVIDATVKTGGDLSTVQTWLRQTARQIAESGRPVPAVVAGRLLPLLDERGQTALATGSTSWLDRLAADIEAYRHEFWAEVEALATTACPPLALFEQARSWLPIGRDLRSTYARVFREAMDVDEVVSSADFAQAEAVTQQFLGNWPAEKRGCILLGAAAHLYSQGPDAGEAVRDQLLWQLGQEISNGRRERSVAQDFIQALRDIGLLGQPLWWCEGVYLSWPDVTERPCAITVPVTFHGVWFNYYRVQHPQVTRMSQVPAAVRQQIKAKVQQLAESKFTGLRLTITGAENGRTVAYTEQGNLFGYVKRYHEEAARQHPRWRIAWATAVDGNINAILAPDDVVDSDAA